jgi:hypothetical protein
MLFVTLREDPAEAGEDEVLYTEDGQYSANVE